MKHRIITTAFALAAALTLGACSKGEQSMNDSAAGQTGTGTTDAQGPNTTDTSAARAGGTAGAAADSLQDSTRRDTSKTPTKTP